MSVEIKDINLFESVFSTISEGILVVDEDGRILRANPASERMFGYESRELFDKKIEILIAAKYKETHEYQRKNYIKNPKTRPLGKGMELWGRKKDNSEFPLEISLNPTKIQNKLVVITIVIDISDRHLLRKKAISNENKMIEAQTLAGIGSWYWDLATNERSWSDQYYKICGLSPGDERLNAQSISNFVHPDDRSKVEMEIEEAYFKRIPYQIENRIVDIHGEIKHTIAKGDAVYNKNGKPIEKFGTIQDITQTKIATDVIAESDRRIRTLINHLPGFAFRSNNSNDWKAEFISDGCYTITGYRAKEFLGSNINFGELIVPEDRGFVWEVVQKSLAKKKSFSIKYKIITKRGKLKYVWGQGEGVFDSNGKLEAIEGFIQDITKQKKLGFDLKAFEAKNKAILLAIPDTMFIQDFSGNYLDVYAPKPERLFVPAEKILGKNMKEVLSRGVYKVLKKLHKKTVKTNQIQIAEYAFKEKNALSYFELRVVPVNNHSLLTIVRNTSEKKEVEKSLEIKNQALEAAGNGIVIVDALQDDFPIIYCNDSFVEITGYDKNEAYGRNCRFLQNMDRDQEEVKIMRAAIIDGKPCKVVLRNYHKNGNLFWNELTITPIYNDAGIVTHFIGVQNDVTLRKKEESFKDQIRQILEMITLHKPLEVVGNLIVKTVEENLKNSTSSILLLNEKKETLHILSGDNLPNPFKESLEGISIHSINCICVKAIKEKKELIVQDITQNIRWPELRGTLKHPFKACWSYPIVSSSQKVLGTFNVYHHNPKLPDENEQAIISDLIQLASVAIERYNTDLVIQKSREQLHKYTVKLEEEVRFRTDELMSSIKKLVASNLNLEDQIMETKLAENRAIANQAMFLAIAKNFPKGAIVVINNQFIVEYAEGKELEKFGLKGNILKGLSLDAIEVLENNEKNDLKQSIQKTLAGAHLTFETQFKNNIYAVNSSPLWSSEDHIQQVLFVFNNISEQKQVELEILNALRKEQELNELKSRFISIASHEFRTPLSAILSSANLIDKQHIEEEEKRKKYVGIIKSNVKSLVAILNDFLSLSKLEEGKVLSQPETFELIDFSKSIIEEIEPNKKEGQTILLKFDTPAINVFIDPKIIRHILTNLLSNAIKYSNQNQEILVSFKKINKFVIIEVEDHGIGIPEEEQNNLFNRFFRAKNVTNINGIGLGLYIVKQYIEMINGNIKFVSTLDEGTTFSVQLPINQKK